MSDKTAHSPNGRYVIRFREHNHSYIDNEGTRYVSGTTFISRFFPKFDAVAVSNKCADGVNPKYAGRDPQEIREEWRAEGQRGSREGDNVHAYAENWWAIPNHGVEPISDRCALLFKQVDFAYRALLNKGFILLSNETIVFSPDLKIAGTIDLLMWDPATQEILILDWKQNKNTLSTENQYQSCLHPIDHLQDTEINKYSLQLSLYQYLLTREGYFPKAKGYRRALIHLTPTTATPIKLDYYDYEIKELLTHDQRN